MVFALAGDSTIKRFPIRSAVFFVFAAAFDVVFFTVVFFAAVFFAGDFFAADFFAAVPFFPAETVSFFSV